MPSTGPRTAPLPRALVHHASVLLLALLGVLAAGLTPAAAADGDAEWTVDTASGDLGTARENYVYTLNPGGRIEDGLVIANHGSAPVELAVYAADGFTARDGALDLVAQGARSTRIGAWVRPERSEVTVAPGRSAEVPFTLALPAATPPGDYMGGVVTSLRQPDGTEQRLGIRVRLRVAGQLRSALAVEDLRVRHAGTANPFGKGDATVTYTVRNTGNTILTARQTVSVSGPFGKLRVAAGKVADSPPLLPGDTWKVSVPVRGVTPALRLTGTVALVPLLTDSAGSIAPLAATTSTAHAWTVPWALLVLVVVLVALVVVAVTLLRRRRAAPRAERAGRENVDAELPREHETSDR
ncbi:DUF916 domain-containing protein [Streptomyces sp. NPDC026672]|uniref:DUF916 domain-containing protein n=1 Tax=unclassified Streptomyces TaxID=2593676 RepID=UPI0033C964A9